ncbi:MAG TPA: aldehyde dehydrogenase family protein [candidate division WOR-3 bacterium]|uniref:Aldehyde dehydrogenase family protein n=1 Tax=candidate division WOR-3 bacterium TaxID=2052148 RepID=A0A9C9JZZ6_UNCW3|nr:aldehyde dehydrogenase family protein [candidate division WOR-3 bacterium]
MKTYKNFINGKLVDSSSGRTFENRNPANWDEVIGLFPKSNVEDLNMAVEAAKKAYKKWRAVPWPKRSEIMRRVAEKMIEKKEELSQLMTREMGKVIKETRGDTQEGIDTALYASVQGRKYFGYTLPSELSDKSCITKREPMGVWGLITPWNFPIAIPSWKIFPCILSGNTAVIKPATYTPACVGELAEILQEAGVPDGVLNVVYGGGGEIGEALLNHKEIVGISFTGSSEIGRRIGEVCGKTLKRCSLELGGKNGQVVLQDADLELALEGVLWGAFGTTGQRCTATSRLILEEPIYDKFIEMLKHKAESLKLGNGLNEEVDVGPVVSESQRDSIHSYVEIGKKEGAKLITGGESYNEGECAKGWFYKPTIFIDVLPTMRIAQEEIFGPVLSVIKAKNFENAMEILNGTVYGLSSSIYTNDLRKAHKAIELAETGIVYINAPTIGAECHLPFGGMKNTGNGHREGGWTAYEIFTEIKSIYIDYSGTLQKAQIDTWD